MRWLALAVYLNDLVPVVVFMVAYQVLAPGPQGWRATPMGRQMMAFAAVTAGLLMLGIAGMFTPRWWWWVPLAVGGHLAFAAVLWWRVGLLLAANHEPAQRP
jgi:hypothetical protein